MKNRILLATVAMLSAMGICESTFAMDMQKENMLSTENNIVSKNDSIYTKITGREHFECNSVVDVICKGDTFYVEMPVELMGRDFLVTNRLQKVQQELNEAGVNKGIVYQNQTLLFEVDSLLKRVTIRQQRILPEVPAGDVIMESVSDNYVNPILARIKIDAVSPDKKSVVFQINEFFNGSNTCINDLFNNINLGTCHFLI